MVVIPKLRRTRIKINYQDNPRFLRLIAKLVKRRPGSLLTSKNEAASQTEWFKTVLRNLLRLKSNFNVLLKLRLAKQGMSLPLQSF